MTGARQPVLSHWRKQAEWLEYALLFLGVSLLSVFLTYRASNWWSAKTAVRDFLEEQQADRGLVVRSGRAPEVNVSLWSAGRVKAYRHSLTLHIEAPIAVLEIDKIRLRVPVFAGTSDLALDRGVGWIEGTARPGENGNVGIAGHRDGFFRGLQDVTVGDVLRVRSLKSIASFRVDQLEIVEPTDVAVLESVDQSTITLVTCYPFYYVGNAPKRYIVKGKRFAMEWTGESQAARILPTVLSPTSSASPTN
jgi:sortase A